MSTPRIPAPLQSPASPTSEARPVLRAKTIATRVTPEELAQVETAAEGAGKTLAVWLRELALKAARERPADPTELMLAEVSAVRICPSRPLHCMQQTRPDGRISVSSRPTKHPTAAAAKRKPPSPARRKSEADGAAASLKICRPPLPPQNITGQAEDYSTHPDAFIFYLSLRPCPVAKPKKRISRAQSPIVQTP